MAKVMASRYQYVNGEGELVTLNPGDDPKDLPKEVQQELEDARLIEDEKRLTPEGYRKTPEQLSEEDREEEQIPRFTPVRSQSQIVNPTSEARDGSPEESGEPEGESKKSSGSKGDKK